MILIDRFALKFKMVTAKKFVIAKVFEGELKEDNFELQDEELPPIGANGVCLKSPRIKLIKNFRIPSRSSVSKR